MPKMRALVRAAVVAVPFSLPAQTMRLPAVWDFTAGSGNGLTTVSVAALRFPVSALDGRVRAGVGLRLTTASGSLALTPAGAHDVPAGVIDTLFVRAAATMVNVSGNLALRLSGRFDAGLNIDLAGFGFGAERAASYRSTAAAPRGSEQASPAGSNVFLYGSKDRGSLNSEFFLEYRAADRVALRGGLSHQLVEYRASRTLASNTDRFRSYTNLVFVGLRVAR